MCDVCFINNNKKFIYECLEMRCARDHNNIYINIRRYNVIRTHTIEWRTETAVQIVLCTLNVFILHNAVLVWCSFGFDITSCDDMLQKYGCAIKRYELM